MPETENAEKYDRNRASNDSSTRTMSILKPEAPIPNCGKKMHVWERWRIWLAYGE